MKKLIIAGFIAVFLLVSGFCAVSFADFGFDQESGTIKQLDALYVDANTYQGNAGFAETACINIVPGQKIYILGWFAGKGKNVDKVVWMLNGEEQECADNYIDRIDLLSSVAESLWPGEFVADNFSKAGFGKMSDMMELLGVDSLSEGIYTLSIVGKLTDGSSVTIKSDFTLVVGGFIQRDFDVMNGDALSYDCISLNGELFAVGNSEVIAAKALIDGTDGSVASIGMRGWYGNANSKILSYGYIVDGGDPVYGDFAVEAESDVTAAGGESRFVVTVDVSGLNDGKVHTIRVFALLENGYIVILNRNAAGKDRDVYVNYKAPGEQQMPLTPPSLSIYACNLAFEDSIAIKYAVNGDMLDRVKLLIWTFPSDSYEYGTQQYILDPIETQVIGGNEMPVFSFNKLAAKQMTDDVYARAYLNVDGVDFYSPVKKYSVLQYAYNKLGKTGTATDKQTLIDLLNSMLDYGAKAQIHFSYKTDRLATDDFYQVKVVGGVLKDGCDNGLFVPGTSLTLTASATNGDGMPFVCWQDGSDNIVGTNLSVTVTVGYVNEIYTAQYGSLSDYSLFEYESNGDGTSLITGLNEHDETEIILPGTAPNGDVVIGIDAAAFAGEDITSITIPASITSIGRNAFKNCDDLTEVYFLGTRAQWEAITIAAGNDILAAAKVYCTDDCSEGLAYEDNGDGTCTIIGIGTCADTDLRIPKNIDGLRVTSIGDQAFYNCTSLESVSIPDSVTSIGLSAFSGCTSLVSIELSDSVTTIDSSMFSGCTSLANIEIPDT